MSGAVSLVVNADDFGLSDGVNRAIVECHRQGILTSASLLANLGGFRSAVGMALETPDLGIGVHLNILRGRPVCPPGEVTSLLDAEGRFLNHIGALYARFRLGRVRPEELDREVRAQIHRVQDAGIRVNHLDSEKHTHMLLPGYAEIVCRVAAESGIRWVRFTRERVAPSQVIGWQAWKALAVNVLGFGLGSLWDRFGLLRTEAFYGLATAPMGVHTYLGLFERLRAGVTEIGCHPGYSHAGAPTEAGTMYVDRFWDQEREALVDCRVRDAVERMGIRLNHFGGL